MKVQPHLLATTAVVAEEHQHQFATPRRAKVKVELVVGVLYTAICFPTYSEALLIGFSVRVSSNLGYQRLFMQ
jgi:hypothetical protein